MRDSDLTGNHSSYYQNNYTKAENQRFTEQFGALTNEFKLQMLAGSEPSDPDVQQLVAQHYEFCLQFWKPNRETYISLATSYLLPSPYRDSYESVASGLAKFHYDAIVIWANHNL